MHEQGERPVRRSLTSPFDDERLDVRVEVAVAKRRRVDRIEELLQIGDVNFDDRGMGGNRIPGGERFSHEPNVSRASRSRKHAMDSRFDRAVRGDTLAMTDAERRGVTVFLGRGKCGTCHFAPLFNGVTPPFYRISEAEIIGVPATADLTRPMLDPDVGRANVEDNPLNRFAFKVTSLRNVALTAPQALLDAARAHQGGETRPGGVPGGPNRHGSP